jgi:hypothetical protein
MKPLDAPESVSPCSVLLMGQTLLDTPTVEAYLRAGLARLVPQGWRSTGGADGVYFYTKGRWQLTASVGSVPGLHFVSASPTTPGTGTATVHLVNITIQDLC